MNMMKSVNTLRVLGVDMIEKANSGHPGIVLGAAPIMYALNRTMLVNPNKPNWFNRDRFILAAGHGSALLYANLHLMDFGLKLGDLKEFRQLDSRTPGHPEYKHTKGIDATSGPLGQGIAMATGMAIAESHLAAKYNKDGLNIVDHYTYVLRGDGDLQEGVTQEAMSLAGHLGLGKLVVLYDSNDIQLDGEVSLANSECVKTKYEAMGWHYIKVHNGNDVEEILRALNLAKSTPNQPTIVEVKTKIGHGSPLEGLSDSHGAPLGKDNVTKLRETLGMDCEPFTVDADVYEDFYENCITPGIEASKKWDHMYSEYKKEYKALFEQLEMVIEGKLPEFDYTQFTVGTSDATRSTGGNIINLLSTHIPHFMGGSADLTKSTKAKGANGHYSFENRLGRNINFGVREHAMGAIVNGMTLSGMKAFGGGFFVFSDYLKPAIRMAALMRIPSIFVFTHDSLAVGEDGPTHQPIEQLSGLRAIPNLDVLRPANAQEVVWAFKKAVESKETPTVIVLTRQNLKMLNEVSEKEYNFGAYVASEEAEELKTVLLASGSELELAFKVKSLTNANTRIVSITSFHELNGQSKKDIQELIPNNARVIALEMATAQEYYRYADEVYGLNDFGASGKCEDVLAKFGFTAEQVIKNLKLD